MENNESQSPPADSGKKPTIFNKLNAQLVASLVIVALLAVVFVVFKPGSTSGGLDNLMTYTDSDGQFSLRIPESHSVIEDAEVFTIADPIEDDSDDNPMWSISVLPLINEVTQDSEKIAADAVDTYIDNFIEGYLELVPQDVEGAPSKLVAEKVNNENSVHGVAMQGTYFQDNEEGLNLYHRDLVIFDEYGNTLVLNFLMPAEDYDSSYDDEIDEIVSSLKFL